MGRWWALAAAVGCTGDDGKDTGTDTGSPSDTGITDSGADTDTDTDTTLSCDEELVPLALEPCGDTTAVTSTTPTGSPAHAEASGTATVVAAGSGLPAVPGAVPIGWLPACDETFPHQVRLMDAEDQTWTFGWRVEGTLAGDSTAAFAIDQEITYRVWSYYSYYGVSTLSLSDATGPMFLYEGQVYGPRLTAEDRGGIDVVVDTSDICTIGNTQHYLVSFLWDGGQVALRTGQSAVMPLPARDLEVVVGQSTWMTDCDDGCGQSTWAYWAEAP